MPDRTRSLWAHDNLLAWEVYPWFDTQKRSLQARVEMLKRLGFKHYAALDVRTIDDEIAFLKKQGIELLATYFPFEPGDPRAKATLEIFLRHQIRPQLWVMQSLHYEYFWRQAKLEAQGLAMPNKTKVWEELSDAERGELRAAARKHFMDLYGKDMPKTQQEHERRLTYETNRIHALAKLAEPYGARVALYNHNGWLGMVDNQLAIIKRLKEMGVSGVGMVYNFSHARDDLHDDTQNFGELWERIEPHVVAVNITGLRWEGELVYPSQGDSELEMMRIIQASGWQGPVGVIAEKRGDAQIILRNYLLGLDWLAAELEQPGSGGPRPFPPAR